MFKTQDYTSTYPRGLTLPLENSNFVRVKAEKASDVWGLLGKRLWPHMKGAQGLLGSSDHILKTAELYGKEI